MLRNDSNLPEKLPETLHEPSHTHGSNLPKPWNDNWVGKSLFLLVCFLFLSLLSAVGGFYRYQNLYYESQSLRDQVIKSGQKQIRLNERLLSLQEEVRRLEALAQKVSSVELAGPVFSNHDVADANPYLSEFELGSFDESLESLADSSQYNFDYIMNDFESLEDSFLNFYQGQLDQQIRENAFPNIWPVEGRLSSRFGPRRSPVLHYMVFHEGLDIAAVWGSDVRATADGVVTFVGYRGGLGKVVVLDHGFGVETIYAHNSLLYVEENEFVEKGDVIAAVGTTGQSTGPHLHYEVHIDGTPVDPLRFLPEVYKPDSYGNYYIHF